MNRHVAGLTMFVLLAMIASRSGAQPATLSAELLKDWTEQKDIMMKIADAMPEEKFTSSKARVIYFLLGHTWDIYGQMAVYLRLNGIVPPRSQRP